jgi:protein-tyrosine phosphatase
MGSSKIANGLAPITWYDEPEADSASRPMLVHCSAGCGRTGAFCTVDSVIDMMKRQRLSKMPGGQPQPQVQTSTADMLMDLDDAISPMTNRQMSFKFDLDHQPTLDRQMSFTFDLDHQPKFEERQIEAHPTLDLSWMQDDSLDLIQRTVEDFRQQRISMVQSLQQYVLCYETVLEWVNRLHEKGRAGPDGRRHRSESYQFA